MATATNVHEARDEAALAQSFAQHERRAFDEAYRRYGALLYSVARNVLHSDEDAEDCVHDVLARLWRNPQRYTVERGALRAFLVVCVRNEAISRTRSSARQTDLAQRAAREADFTEQLEMRDFLEERRVREALALLPDEQREAIVLAYFGAKTHVQIAAQLGAPLGTIKSRISLALRKLGAALATENPVPNSTRSVRLTIWSTRASSGILRSAARVWRAWHPPSRP